jgi:tetratricopeptide (TPR) repeat protein
VSGGAPEWWGTPRPAREIADELADLVRRTSKVLGPDDRVRLLTIDTYADEILPFQPPGGPVRIDPRIATAGMSSLYDGLIAALLRPAAPDRRHVVIAMTKAEDTISTVEIAAVQNIARRSDAVLHIVLGTSLVGDTTCKPASGGPAPGEGARLGISGSSEEGVSAASPGGGVAGNPFQSPAAGICRFPRRKFWQPVGRRVAAELPTLAESTGGAFYGFDALGFHRSFADEVERVFNQFRQGYVLRYTPQGVTREGWHDIAVSVPAHPGYAVQARRGYAVEVASPVAARAAAPAAATLIASPGAATVEWLAEAFARAEYAAFENGLSQSADLLKLIRDYRAAGSPWTNAPRRDAVFALEIAVAGLRHAGSTRADINTREEALRLLEQSATLVRHPLGADAFECTWYWAGIAAVEGLIQPGIGWPLVTRALARCPDEPRFHLAAAVVTDQLWPVGTTTPLPAFERREAGGRLLPQPSFVSARVIGPSAVHRQNVTRRYEAAMKFPGTAVEARIRAAWFAFRVGEFDRALALTEAASGSIADLQLQYMRDLVRGLVLRAQGQFDAAAASFRSALATWPDAQAARAALMALQVAHGDRQEAEALAEAIQTADGALDPWWRYWQGDFRGFADIRAQLRELAR